MLVESTGDLNWELEKQAQPQTGTLGLLGASLGTERAASLPLRLLDSAQPGAALGRGGGVVDNSVAIFLLPLRRIAPGFPFHGDCTVVKAVPQGDIKLQKERGHGS